MAILYPTSTLGFQHVKSDGSPAAGYYAKYYEASTDAPMSCGFNSTGVADDGVTELLVDKVKLNDAGIAINNSLGAVNPHVPRAWRFCLFPTATDADNNNFAVAVIDIPKTVPAPLDIIPSTAPPATSSINHIEGPSGDTILLGNLLNWMAVTVRSFNEESNDGTTDADTAINNALAYSGNVIFTEGVYKTSGVSITGDYKNIHFIGNVVLKASTDDVVLFKQNGSYCRHQGTFRTDSNSRTGIYGAVLGPVDLTDTATAKDQIGNIMPGIILDAGVEEGVIVQCGPDVSGTNSLCKGNVFPSIYSQSARRSLWLKSASNAGATIPSRNKFHNVVSNAGSATNTLVQIDAGQYNEIHGLFAEDINSGSTPNSTPTALKVRNVCPTTSVSNDNNKVFGGAITNCTRHIDNANSTTKTYGLTYNTGASVLGSITSV